MSTERLVGLVSDERIAQEIVAERLALQYLHSAKNTDSILTPDDIADEVISLMFDDIDALDERNGDHPFPSQLLNQRLRVLPEHIEIQDIPPYVPTRQKEAQKPSFSETVATILNLTDDTPKEFFKALPRNAIEEAVYSTGKVLGAFEVTAESVSKELEGTSRKVGVIAATATVALLITGVSVFSPKQEAGANELKLSYDRTSVSVPFDTTTQDKAQSIIAAAEAAAVAPETVSIKDGTLHFTDSRLLEKGQRDAVIAGTFAAMAPDVVPSAPEIANESQPENTTAPAPEQIQVPDAHLEVQAIRGRIVSEAQKYLGVKEDPATPNHSKEVDEYFQNGLTGSGAEWCASFVSRVMHDSDLPFSGGKSDGYKGPEWQLEFVNNVFLWAKDNGSEVFDQDDIRNGFKPEAGDIVIFNKYGDLGDGRSGVNHIGLVEGYDPATGLATNIEGNFHDSVDERVYDPLVKVDETNGKKLAG